MQTKEQQTPQKDNVALLLCLHSDSNSYTSNNATIPCTVQYVVGWSRLVITSFELHINPLTSKTVINEKLATEECINVMMVPVLC